jgi:predicted DsbA family dithiol-disulfide isomerase
VGVDKSSGAPRATKDQPATGAPGAPGGAAIGARGEGVASNAKPGSPRVELYVMSQCPYGVQAEQGFKDAVEKLGDNLDFHIDFIGDKTPSGDLNSMHGPKEVKGDIAQVCAQKYSAKWFQMMLCQGKNSREVDTNWEACAKDLGMPVDDLRACIEGDEGKTLLSESFARSKAKGATGSPTIFLNGQKYAGGRRSNDFFRAICAAYTGDKPEACASIPESPKVNVTMLTDKRCSECDTRRMEGQLKSAIANPVMKTLDYSDAEGKKLYADVKPGMLPVAIFDSTLDADKEASQQISRALKEAGSFKLLSMGGAWNPVCADDKGCELDECKPTLQCKAEEPNKLDVFVMSQCPFGVKGLDAMQEVIKNFGGKVGFSVHFIGDGDAKSGLKSMHGPGEVDEDIREVCAAEHYAKDLKFMDYIWCRNKSIKDTNWEACTGEKTGIDAAVIKKCVEDEGKSLLEKSFAYSKTMGIGASPTWLANGKYKFSGVDPESIKTQLCAHNKLEGCENKLSGPPAQQGNAQPAGCGG